LGGIVMLAWITLWWLEQSPYGWLFHRHGGVAHGQTLGWFYAGAFLLGWLLMSVAMMLPTTVPLVRLFRRMIARQAHAPFLILLLLAGYLTAWLAFGAVALGLLWAVDQTLANAILPQAWVWGAGLFLLAGAFQFSPLKYACLDKCRTPLGFLLSHWHGRNRRSESFNVGWSHGIFCVGCCWALMMLMFAVGTASLGWMLLLALIMAIEKNAPWGRRMSRPLGVILLGVGAGMGAYNLAI
jgi:predicted metal-binding membrane protein